MKPRFMACTSQIQYFTIIFILFLFASTMHATTHVIQFGGSSGLEYSPNNLSVSVGDTIKWEGDFSAHPLSSTSIPAGAASFHQGSGSVFVYVIEVAGTYQYQCDFHASLGMTGTITATLTGVENNLTSMIPHDIKLYQNYPNPFNPTTTINYQLPASENVVLKVYNLLGEEIATLVNGSQQAGIHSVIFNAGRYSSGIYFYSIRTNNLTLTKKMMLVK